MRVAPARSADRAVPVHDLDLPRLEHELAPRWCAAEDAERFLDAPALGVELGEFLVERGPHAAVYPAMEQMLPQLRRPHMCNHSL